MAIHREAIRLSGRVKESFYLPENVRKHLLTVGRPLDKELPAGTYVRQIYNRLLIDLSWNSSRLEGNTYTRLETELLFARGETAEGKELVETQMILNHKEAIELLVTQAEEIGFNRYTICNLMPSDAAMSSALKPRSSISNTVIFT